MAFPRKRDREFSHPSDYLGAESMQVADSDGLPRSDCGGGVAAPSGQFQRSVPFAIGSESWGPSPQPRRSPSGDSGIAAER